jgi:hypothetical protein
LDAWRENTPSFVITERESLTFPKSKITSLKINLKKISNGEICFFSYDWKNLGLDYDWVTNQIAVIVMIFQSIGQRISDLNPSNGDIKYVWEKISFFVFISIIIRYDYHFEETMPSLYFQK